ncbi:MAG: tetratricopeptide repeat protein [Leptolyngbya sp.]|nr:tetratricopeptide repeat protein [Candidatus Melainabacteria bacterium]
MSFSVRALSLGLALSLSAACLSISSPAFAQGATKKTEWHRCLIAIYKSKGQIPQVIDEYAALVALDPKDPQIRFEYGAYLHKMGRVKEAIGQYKKAADANPGNSDYQGAVGDALVSMKDYSSALAYYQKAGPKFAGKLSTTTAYVQQLRQIQQYNADIKKRQSEDE